MILTPFNLADEKASIASSSLTSPSFLSSSVETPALVYAYIKLESDSDSSEVVASVYAEASYCLVLIPVLVLAAILVADTVFYSEFVAISILILLNNL